MNLCFCKFRMALAHFQKTSVMLPMQGLQSAVNYTVYVAGRDAQAQPNYASPAVVLNVGSSAVTRSHMHVQRCSSSLPGMQHAIT